MNVNNTQGATSISDAPIDNTVQEDISSDSLSARIEPFDSYWQAPDDVESGFTSFSAYYRHTYLQHLPADKDTSILVISCGPGYLVNLLQSEGYFLLPNDIVIFFLLQIICFVENLGLFLKEIHYKKLFQIIG